MKRFDIQKMMKLCNDTIIVPKPSCSLIVVHYYFSWIQTNLNNKTTIRSAIQLRIVAAIAALKFDTTKCQTINRFTPLFSNRAFF